MAELNSIMVYEINEKLQKAKIHAQIHLHAGCASCGAYLESPDKSFDKSKILKMINDYLKEKWLRAEWMDEKNLMILSLFVVRE